jgi:hypothetical protein
MALTFNGTSSKLTGPNLITGYPCSMFCWIRPASLTLSQMVMGAGDFGGNSALAMQGAGAVAGDPMRAFSRDGAGGSQTAASTSGMALATWQPCLVVFRSDTSRSVYFANDPISTNNTSNVPVFANFDRTIIGAYPISDTLWAQMDIAHAAFWSYAMQDDDWISLKYGVFPDQVQPQALIDYFNLETQGATQTGVKGNVLTASNTAQASTSPTMNQAIPDTEPLRYDGSWVWFSEPRAVTYNGATYLAWTSKNGSCGISKYVHATKVRSYFILSAALEVDDHNNPSIYIRSDGRILVVYGKHNDDQGRRFCISTNPEDITAWSAEGFVGAENESAYNNLNYLSGNGRLYMHFRGWNSGTYYPHYMAHSDNEGTNWDTPIKIFDQAASRPYVKSISNNVDRMDFYLTQSHPTETISNLYHCMAKLDAGTLKFYKSDGTTELTLPISVNASLDKIYDSGGTVAGWQWDAKYDSNGYPRVLFVKLISTSDIRYMFTRWTGSAWTTPVEITGAGAVIAAGTQYAPGICFSADDIDEVILGVESGGKSEMQAWATTDDGATWSKSRDITTASGAGIDNMRPVVPRNATVVKSIWWQGTYTADNVYSLNAKFELGDPVTSAGEASGSIAAISLGAVSGSASAGDGTIEGIAQGAIAEMFMYSVGGDASVPGLAKRGVSSAGVIMSNQIGVSSAGVSRE